MHEQSSVLRRLADIPNQAGFRFVGVTKGAEEWTCVVRVDPVGGHSVYREADGSPCWFQLSAWRPIKVGP